MTHNYECCAICCGDDCCGDALCEDHERYKFCDSHGGWFDGDTSDGGRVCYVVTTRSHGPRLITETLCPACLEAFGEDHPLRMCDLCGVHYGEQMDFAGGDTCTGCRAYLDAHAHMLRAAERSATWTAA